jgi:hypothetical protein
MANKYWIANNPNSEVTDAEAVEVKELAQALDVGGVDALTGVASPGNAALATKCMEVNINGVTYFIPLFEANIA